MQQMGYDATGKKSKEIAAALRDLSVLVGPPQTAAVVLETGGQFTPGIGLDSDAAGLAQRARDVEQGIFKTLVMGTFKNGKSTLLNAILGNETLPARAAPCTAVISMLVHGHDTDVVVYEMDKEAPRRLSWEDFVREFQLRREDQETLDKKQPIDRFKHVKYVQIERPHQLCADGVRLIDSPGLGEATARTMVTTTFLKEAHAIIFVLNAIHILSQEEREFISNHFVPQAGERVDNVFFVVNRINDIKSKADVEDIKDFVRQFLEKLFRTSSGQFDEGLYNRRVFFVNALAGLQARMTMPPDHASLEASGLLAFEREIERFLTGEEKVKATFGSTVEAVRAVGEQVCKHAVSQKVALDQPVEELEKRRREAEARLKEVEDEKKDIERTILLAAETVKGKIFANLLDYVQEMHDTWPQDAGLEASGDANAVGMINLDEIGVMDVLKAGLKNEAAKERINHLIGTQVAEYLRHKMGVWAQRVPRVIEADLEAMRQMLTRQVEEFSLKLDEIRDLFASGAGAKRLGVVYQSENGGHRMAQSILGVCTFDPSNAAESMMGSGQWSAFFGRMLQQILIGFLISVVFPPGAIAWIAWLAVEAFFIRRGLNRFKRELLIKVGEHIYEHMQRELPQRRGELDVAVGKQFEKAAAALRDELQQRIDEMRREQDRIIAQKRDVGFSAESEKTRLDRVAEKVNALVATIERTSGWGQTLTTRQSATVETAAVA